MESLIQIADKTIVKPNHFAVVNYQDGRTQDIIFQIIKTHNSHFRDTAKFAKYLQGKDLNESLSNIWHFAKRNIRYRLDDLGYQFIKSPGKTWADKYADCKSFSIFVASILQNLNIPFSYRFVGYQKNKDYTHVYVVVPDGKKTYIVDCVVNAYNKEKKYHHKKDFPMTKIVSLSGIAEQKIIDLGIGDLGNMTEGEMDLRLARSRFLTQKDIVESMRGIGSVVAEKHQNSIDMLDDAISVVAGFVAGKMSEDDFDCHMAGIAQHATSGEYSIHNEVAGIGSLRGKIMHRLANKKRLLQKRLQMIRKLSPAQKKSIWKNVHLSGIGKTKGFLKKIASKVKSAVKATAKVAVKAAKGAAKIVKTVAVTALKVLTLPGRLIIKGILELELPKAADFFLYLFITDPAVLAKAPAAVQAKRKKASNIADFIVNVIGMKRPHFMSIIRTGIMKKHGKSPEAMISDMMNNKVSGIGIISDVVTILIAIIKKLQTLFGKKTEPVSTSDAPDNNDFGNMTPAEKAKMTAEVKAQSESGTPDASGKNEPGNFESGGKKTWSSF